MERHFKGIWIPKEVYLNKELSWIEKILFVEIDSLDGEEGCYASNEYFAEHLQVSKGRISKMINKLVKMKYISSELIYKKGTKQIEKRVLKNNLTYSQKRLEGIVENDHRGIVENDQDNNKDKNNTLYINIYSPVIDYLNEKCGTSYKSTTKKTQTLIRARQVEGFELEDFKKVIDNKAASWLDDPKMCKFLRPETLFGNKFEGYLNEKPKGGRPNGKPGGNTSSDSNSFEGIKLNFQ